MNKMLQNLSDAIKAFNKANTMLKGEGKDSHILVEHIEVFLYLFDKNQVILRDIQKAVGYNQPKVHRVVKHLKRLGWVTVRMADHDERQRLVTLTQDGINFGSYLSYKLSSTPKV
jgi:DNA-binding MarR family transcriptional regulator